VALYRQCRGCGFVYLQETRCPSAVTLNQGSPYITYWLTIVLDILVVQNWRVLRGKKT
jgi:hypothetical protein